jgi:hypothetical protein
VRLATVVIVLPMAVWVHEVGLEVDQALAWSVHVRILFLLSMSLVIVGAIFSTIYLAQKRAQWQGRSEAQQAGAL